MKREITKRVKVASDSIRNVRVKARAFYVISHERSGTHFLINTINSNFPVRVGYGVGKGAGHGWNNIGEWFGPYDDHKHKYVHIDSYNMKFWQKGLKRNSIIKSHADSTLFQERFHPAPVIYIYRNPVDVMASWFHYLNNPVFYRNNPEVEDMTCNDFSNFLRRPLNSFLKFSFSGEGASENVVERWAVHVSGWLKQEDVCCIRYEELKQNLPSALESISSFLGIDSKREMQQVSIGCSKSILPRKGIVGDGVSLCQGEDLEFIKKTTEAYGLSWDSFGNCSQ